MINIIYFVAVLIVAFWAVVSGFRKGITHQIASLLGFAFGAVAARILTPEFSQHFSWVTPLSQSPEFQEFSTNLVCAVCIYIVVFVLFYIFSGILQWILATIPVGMFNRILGSVFALTKNLLWLSIVFNLLLCFSSESELLRYERANDGNLMAAVMSMTHTFLGCDGAEEFAHFYQLKEAKSISCNFNKDNNVIIKNG